MRKIQRAQPTQPINRSPQLQHRSWRSLYPTVFWTSPTHRSDKYSYAKPRCAGLPMEKASRAWVCHPESTAPSENRKHLERLKAQYPGPLRICTTVRELLDPTMMYSAFFPPQGEQPDRRKHEQCWSLSAANWNSAQNIICWRSAPLGSMRFTPRNIMAAASPRPLVEKTNLALR